MKRIIFTFLTALLVIIGIASFKQKQYGEFYYTFSEKKTLTPVATKLIVRFAQKLPLDSLKTVLTNLSASSTQKWLSDDRTVVINAPSSTVKNDLLNDFSKSQNVVSVHPIYTIDQGAEVGITDELTVQFLNNISQSTIDSLNTAYHVTIIKKGFDYLLRVSPHSDALKIANIYYETGFTKFSCPNFIVWPELYQQHIPNDTYFNEQWNFHNTGQVINDGHTGTPGADIKGPEAWHVTEGSNSIIVAVLDEGVTSNHPDLPNTRQVRLNGSNFADGDPNDPSPNGTIDNHGNACAGLVAATQDNNQGITGICPNCEIMPIKIFNANESGISAESIADAITFAYTNGADILSNSWGFDGVTDPNAYPQIVTAIQNATTNGRGGKGAVVVFAASNSASHVVGRNGTISFPADVNISGVLTVGASDRYDHQADYSPTSNPNSPDNQIIDLVAPSNRAYPPAVYADQGLTGGIQGETFEIWSIDMPGITLGYNQWPNVSPYNLEVTPGEQLPSTGTNFDAYTGRFGGTSAACPQVAGVAALILSIDPNLTQQQIFNIITSTADKVGGYTYTNGRSNEMGYGRLNACNAVTAAFSETSISGSNTLCSSASYSISSAINGGSITWSVSPSGIVSLNPSGNSVTATKISQGNATLTATLTSSCGNTTISKNISTQPVIDSFSVVDEGCYNGYESWSLSAYPNMPNATNWQWTVDNPNSDIYLDNPNSQSTNADVPGGKGGGVSVTYKDACGETSDKNGVTIWGGSCQYNNIEISPNPASKSITITIQQPENKNFKAMKSSSVASIGLAYIKEVKIYDAAGGLRKQQVFSGKSNWVQMDVSTLSPAIYLIQVSDGKNVAVQKLAIQ